MSGDDGLEASSGAAPDDRTIDQRIGEAFETLTSNERRLADVVLGALGNLASFTAAELAAQANVSTATASRFFQRLGYRTYHDARRLNRAQQAWGSPLRELGAAALVPSDADDFSRHIARDIQNLIQTREMLDQAALRTATTLLAGARTVWVVGFRNSMPLAFYARTLLMNAKPDVRLLPVAGMTLAEDIASFAPTDCLLALAFRRRPQAMRDTMAISADMGVPSVLITDLSAVRSARRASAVLRCHSGAHGMFDSYAAAISVVNYLCTAVAHERGDATLDRLRRIEDLHVRLGGAAVPVLESKEGWAQPKPAKGQKPL